MLPEPANLQRCAWAQTDLMHPYHDTEWGVPQHDDRMLFQMLTLEGAQAGLSWSTILRKRAAYVAAFAGFDPAVVAGFDVEKIEALVADAGIVRHRGKIESTVSNAAAFLAVQADHGSFARFLWAYVNGTPVVSRRAAGEPLPARTALSDRISADLRARKFKFVGSTIVYAFLQATGLVDDHAASCFRASPVGGRIFAAAPND